MSSRKEAILSMIYPRRCPICMNIVTPKGFLICAACKNKAVPICEPRCKKCSKPLHNQQEEYCYDCKKNKHEYDVGIALFPYNSYMKRSLEYFKFHNRQEYAKWYAKAAADYLGHKLTAWQPECLIPIPIHKSRMMERGYNQASLLARQLGQCLGIPIEEELLIRSRKTLPQKSLNNKERINNLQNAFQISQNVVQYKKVLLIDDIYTTGSTIDACSRVLFEAGVENVYFFCLCIGYGT